MSKLTAVEWLIQEFQVLGIYSPIIGLKCEKAKEMEKGQLERAYAKGFLTEGDLIICCEQYIEETYGK